MNGFGSPYGQPPSAWKEHFTEDGRAYYYNAATKATQWTKPEELMSSGEASTLRFSPTDNRMLTASTARPCEPALEGIHCRGRSQILV